MSKLDDLKAALKREAMRRAVRDELERRHDDEYRHGAYVDARSAADRIADQLRGSGAEVSCETDHEQATIVVTFEPHRARSSPKLTIRNETTEDGSNSVVLEENDWVSVGFSERWTTLMPVARATRETIEDAIVEWMESVRERVV
ncbi:hypothetical protein K2Z84_05330 [Candidatus Binatia bacterium]|nr:hypothetical protein [Candidatus Binatia bacterium]